MRIAGMQYANRKSAICEWLADFLFTNFTASPKPHAYIYEKSPGTFRGSFLYAQM